MEGIVTGTVVEVIKCTFDPIKRHVCYFFNHESKVQTLKDQIENLTNERARMKEYVGAATRNGELIFQDVDKWLTSVNKKTTEDLEEFKAHEDKAKGRCFIGLCPNFFSRYHLSKKAEAEAKAVAELLSGGAKLMKKSIAHLPDPQEIVSTFGSGFEAFESRRHILEGIMEALKDPNIQRIGLYGMSGVGKTMLVKALAKKARDEDLFDEVVFATISNSKTKDTIDIQKEIAEAFGMRLEEGIESWRATRLMQRLKNGRRILIVLDDIWKKIDLEAVGISFQQDQNVAADEATSETSMLNSQVAAAARCKLLLTSRNQDTLCNQMSTEKNYLVGTISDEEAMNLFTKIVGNKVEEDGYKCISMDVVKKCAGLPIALSVIANALKSMDLNVWEDALQKLKRSIPTDIDEMEGRVYAAVELSYNYLRSKEAQEIFLLCSLWPQGSDISISDLIKYSWGLGLLERVRTLNEARNRVNCSVLILKGCGLLLANDKDGLVKLHDIVRDVSISIGLKDKQMLVVDDENHMEELLEKGKLKTCSVMSMPYGCTHELPSVLECPQLKLLSILSKNSFLKVSDDFFKESNQLKVLNLTGMNLQSLPSSFIFLTNLKMLSLHECKLGDIAIIGRLKKLEILSFLKSNIELLPLELAQLSKLKLLNLSNCSRLKVIPENLISKLCCLEELLMGNSFDGWGVGSNASLMELKHLSHLIALEISIPDAQMMPRSLFSENLKRFKIHIGDVWNERYIIDKTSTTLKLKLNTNMYLDHGIQMLLRKSEDIYLDEVKCVKNILSMLERPGIFQLKNLCIKNCSELQHVTDSSRGISYVVFPKLESLSLLNLINLEIIHGGPLEAGSFNKLRVIRVNSCRKMRNLLSSSMARELHQLQEIEVSECENIIEIVENQEEDINDKLEFCSLRLLKIIDLPNLITFHCERARNSKSEQEYIGAKTEVSLQSNLLFNSKDALPRLEELELRSINIQRIWDNTASFCSPNLTRLIIQRCSNLRNLFSSRMARSLQQLKRLQVEVCQTITEIVTTDYEMPDDEISFPNLEFLALRQLPKLTRFCGNPIQLSSLKELRIRDCPVLVSFVYNRVSGETSTQGEAERKESNENLHSNMSPLFDEKVALPKLERLEFFRIGSWRRIWGDQLAVGSFNNLNDFAVLECDGFLNIFPITMLDRLQRLSKLAIRRCRSVEEIFKCEEPSLSQRKQPAPKLEISSLTQLNLFNLPKLKCFSVKTIECPLLRTVEVNSCRGVELLFGSDYLSFQKAQEEEEQQSLQPLFWVNEITFPNLEELTLSSNKNLKEVWRARGQLASQCFPNLKNLQYSLWGMDHHIGGGLLLNCFLSFPCLKKLQVSGSSFEEMFQGEVKDLPNTQLSELKLSYLLKLRCLWNGKFEPLEPLFQELTTLEVRLCTELKNLVPSSKSFPNLVILDISYCDGLINLLTHSVAKSFLHLTRMRVADCESIEGIIAEDEAKDDIVFTQLTNLELNNLPSLQNFCPSNAPIEFPSLDELVMTRCPRLKIFCQGALSTPKLQKVQLIKTENEDRHRLIECDLNNTIRQLYQEKVGFVGLNDLDFSKFSELIEIWNCSLSQTTLEFQNLTEMKLCNLKSNSLRYLLTPSMSMCLVNLENMEIENCNVIEQVVADGAELAKTYKIILPQLEYICLESCPNLTSFCLGSYDFECPVLHSLNIVNCPKMVTFVKDQVDDIISESYRLGKGMIEAFFNNKVSFPILERLDLSFLSNVKSIWDNQISINSFDELKILKVKYCEKLLSIFPSNTLATFQGVEEITIKACHSLQVLLELQGINIIELHAIDTKLKQLRLIRLPKMKHVWDRDFQGVLSLENLRLVRAFRCWNLENLFPISVAKAGLAQLEEVDISFCGLEGLFGNGRGQEEVARFEFPSLTKLKLVELPRLKSLYPGEKGTIFCPKLEKLQSFHCGKIKVLGTNQLYNVQEKNVEDQLDLQYQKNPLFCIKEVAFKLRKLSLSNDDIEIINVLQFPTSEIFHEITALHIMCYHDGLVAFPFCFLERFHNLEKLVVRCGKFKELFPCEGDINEENSLGTVLSRIRHLRLHMLGDLRHLQNQNTRQSLILKNLETLEVEFCDTLPSLEPSLASFPNLMKLYVINCKGMENILAISTCQCLVRLKQMVISECYMVTEIVANHGVEETCEITFSKLEGLAFHCLPNLTSFCSGNYSFNFPSLERVYVIGCPGLKIFSERVLNTPRLESVHDTVDDTDKSHWAGDLNSTIQQLYTEKVGYRGLGYLDFSRFPDLTDLWIDMNPQEKLDFKSLQYLEFCNYNGLQYLFTPSMALGLVKLCSLKVKNCASIEHVITEEGFDGSALVKDVILLPLLESVSLESCPNLTSFYLLGRDALECLSLNKITVIDCPNMITFASSLLRERKKDTIHEASKERSLSGKEVDGVCFKSFFTNKVELPSLVHLKLSSVNIPKIWEDSKLSTMSSCVQHLTALIVESCGNLKYLFPSPMVKSCAQLETLEIRDSKLMAGVILDDIQISEDHSEPSSSENHLEFPSMRELVIDNCPSLETFITNTLNGVDEAVTNTPPLLDEKVSFPSLERLKLRNIGPKVVWHGQCPLAKSLLQLRITDCGMLREVMTCAPNEVIGDGIVFNHLKYLELGCLPNLESFSSAQCTFGFPSLVEVTAQDCPTIKTFCRGKVSTPKLKRLQLTESKDEELCEGNLNTTIQDFFAKKSKGT